jgi:hypothetical protein
MAKGRSIFSSTPVQLVKLFPDDKRYDASREYDLTVLSAGLTLNSEVSEARTESALRKLGFNKIDNYTDVPAVVTAWKHNGWEQNAKLTIDDLRARLASKMGLDISQIVTMSDDIVKVSCATMKLDKTDGKTPFVLYIWRQNRVDGRNIFCRITDLEYGVTECYHAGFDEIIRNRKEIDPILDTVGGDDDGELVL